VMNVGGPFERGWGRCRCRLGYHEIIHEHKLNMITDRGGVEYKLAYTLVTVNGDASDREVGL
jgi:hypothetical protein